MTVRDPDVAFETHSNPGRQRRAGKRSTSLVLWGDFHSHSVVSDGTGSPYELYRYARDVAGLDFFL